MTCLLISHGSEVNYADRTTGWTPLMLAASNGHKTAVTILLKNGADCNMVNNLNQTALDIARKMRRKDIENELEPVTRRRTTDPGIYANLEFLCILYADLNHPKLSCIVGCSVVIGCNVLPTNPPH